MSIETRIKHFESLKPFCTFGIGGKARQFISVYTIEEMKEIRRYVFEKKIPFLVIGKGSNSLFDDRGFDGLVILNKIDFIDFDEGRLYVGAGTSFSLLGINTVRKGWAGLEFAAGIPGSVGGAIYMNAGANGMETCDPLTAVGYIDDKGEFIEKNKEAFFFAYRTSSFQKGNQMIVSGRFELKKNQEVRSKQRTIIEYRRTTQPYVEKSAGCIFHNPPGGNAGALIESCDLKGKKIGGAEVSTLHANFIVNRGNATARDVLDLVIFVKKTVREKTGKELKIEIRKIPYQLDNGIVVI